MLDKKDYGQEAVIVLPGQVLDNNNAHEVMQIVDDSLKANKRIVLFDMSTVEFLSSAGVGSLISSLSTLNNGGGTMCLFGLSDKILHVLQVLDLGDYMPIEADLESAYACCRSVSQIEKSTD